MAELVNAIHGLKIFIFPIESITSINHLPNCFPPPFNLIPVGSTEIPALNALPVKAPVLMATENQPQLRRTPKTPIPTSPWLKFTKPASLKSKKIRNETNLEGESTASRSLTQRP
jgi:hypothetical protein